MDPSPRPPAAPDLLVEVDGRVLRLAASSAPHPVGRAADAAVVLLAPSVSRQHAVLDVADGVWVLRDCGSALGTYVDGARVGDEPVPVVAPVQVSCGPGPGGASFRVTPAPSGEAEATQAIALPVDVTTPRGVPAAGRPRSGPDLLVVVEGHEHRFRHPETVTVGRRGDCTVVLADPASSRLHGRIDAVPGAWTWTNLSGEGTFADGRRVTTRRFDQRLVLRLGHPVAGTEITLVPILSAAEEERRIARRRLRRRLTVVGAGAAAVLVVAAVVTAALVVGRDSSSARTPSAQTLSAAELDRAKAATVKITADTRPAGSDAEDSTYHASGSIIRSDGLILTNAHVAAPESEGLDDVYGGEGLENPRYLLISLTDGRTDTNAAPSYRARVVVADGRLDAAIVRIYARADGRLLRGRLDLPTVPIGSSADLRAGDAVTVLGFPAVAGSGESITVTTGVVSTVLNDPALGPRSELDTDARIAPGNSGGMAVDDSGELIGVPTSLFSDDETTVTSGRIRSIDAVKDLIRRAEDE